MKERMEYGWQALFGHAILLIKTQGVFILVHVHEKTRHFPM